MHVITKMIAMLLIWIWLVPSRLACQQSDSLSNVSPPRYFRLPRHVVPSKSQAKIDLEDEVALTLFKAKNQLGLYGLMVGISLDAATVIGSSGSSTYDIVRLDQVVGASQAMIITSALLSQESVAALEAPDYFSIRKSDNSPADTRKVIQTRLSVEADILDVATGQVLGSLVFDVWATGRSGKKSKSNVIERLRDDAKQELKRFYWPSAELTLGRAGELKAAMGTRSGIRQGAILELTEIDRIWESDGDEWLVPGGSAAIATVTDTSADSSGVKILRQWREIYPGAWAVELPSSICGVGFNFSPAALGSYVNFGLCVQAAPLSQFDFGLTIHAIKITDSYQENDYGFGLGGFGIWRFINTPKMDWGAKIGLDLDFPFKRDDDGNWVNTILFSSSAGLVAEWLITKRIDFLLHIGYRFGMRNDNWDASEDDLEIPAYWTDAPPVVKNSGMMISTGFRYLIF